jgi:hypothetical protein
MNKLASPPALVSAIMHKHITHEFVSEVVTFTLPCMNTNGMSLGKFVNELALN